MSADDAFQAFTDYLEGQLRLALLAPRADVAPGPPLTPLTQHLFRLHELGYFSV